jgi:hypothetical protein
VQTSFRCGWSMLRAANRLPPSCQQPWRGSPPRLARRNDHVSRRRRTHRLLFRRAYMSILRGGLGARQPPPPGRDKVGKAAGDTINQPKRRGLTGEHISICIYAGEFMLGPGRLLLSAGRGHGRFRTPDRAVAPASVRLGGIRLALEFSLRGGSAEQLNLPHTYRLQGKCRLFFARQQ